MAERASGPRLVLASASPARRAMLVQAGLAFDVDPADIDEAAIRDAMLAKGPFEPADIAVALAVAKAEAVAVRHPGALVVGSDQVLALGDRLFEKPGSMAAARDHLRALRARTHALHSGVALVADGAIVWRGVETARLTMRDFSDDFLDRHLAEAGEGVTGSVGAYKLEGLGVQLFERIEGDYFTILGLPLLPLLAELRRHGVIAR